MISGQDLGSSATMKIAVMGAGAVGCYYGARLAEAGHDVVLIARPEHVEAINARGLWLEKDGAQQVIQLRASAHVNAVQDASLVLFCVKSMDTETAGKAMAQHLAADATVLSLQNSVDNAECLQRILSQAVIPAVVYVATVMAGPGHVRHHGGGELVLGSSPASIELAAMLTTAGIPSTVSDNAIGALWAKMVLNCAYNAMSAISQQDYGTMAKGTGVMDVINDVVQECLAVADKLGVVIPGDSWSAVERVPLTMPRQLSSTAQDLARGKPTEIDHLNGYIVRKGQELGIATPANRMLLALVKLLEGRMNKAIE
jgi:2-dehydropantoate 2-reductase